MGGLIIFGFFNGNIKSVDVNQIISFTSINLIDIREPYEYAAGHLPNAVNIPMGKLLTASENYLNKQNEYYIICQSGGRSSRATTQLAAKGYNVINVSGGTGSYRGTLVR